MSRQKRKWHPNFLKYTKFIANHPNYEGMPEPYKKDGSVRWVAAGDLRNKRLEWWNRKRQEVDISKEESKWISKVARKIHPTGEKPCQICGKIMKLDYVYPNKKGTLSPGAMSDAPDRFEGYHTYNLCCRQKQDTGRHKENLQRYGEDRRAYEYWVDGDWKAASWLMQVFRKNKISPDHIGPLSLGFAHRPRFNSMTREDNSAKGNRMTLSDVHTLLQDEKNGEKVISWHSRYLWNLLKDKIKSSEDAKLLSALMKKNMHYLLKILYIIHNKGHDDFLIKNFLNLRYAYYSISFKDFDSKTGTFKKMIKKKGSKKQYENNAKRYIRKSLLSLEKYASKGNRKLTNWHDEEIDEGIGKIIAFLNSKKEIEAKKQLFSILKRLALKLEEQFNQHR